MKVFWSWQSDTDGKTGRHFVREALELAIDELKEPRDIEEPAGAFDREQIHLDYGRKGNRGSPTLAETILSKIQQASVFVCDVTPVATRTAPNEGMHINSNVAIEYGFALRALTDERILLIQNEHYGQRSDLPFDLRHKAGPITYRLAPGAIKSEREAELRKLVAVLVQAIRPYLETTKIDAPVSIYSGELPKATPAVFFNGNEVLATFGQPGIDVVSYRFDRDNIFYLRVIPNAKMNFKISKLRQIFENSVKPEVLRSHMSNTLQSINAYGLAFIEPRTTDGALLAITQLFPTGEIWGCSSDFIPLLNLKGIDDPRHLRSVIPVMAVYEAYKRTLKSYLDVATVTLSYQFPITVEAGVVEIKDIIFVAAGGHSPPIQKTSVATRRVLNAVDDGTQLRFLDEYMSELLDTVGWTWPSQAPV